MKTISGIRALGRALGVSHAAAAKYVNDPRWPFGRGPWPASKLEAMRIWRDQELQPAADSAAADQRRSQKRSGVEALTEARTKHTIVAAQAKLLDIRIKEKKYHSADDCRRRRILNLNAAKDDLLAIPDALPAEEPVRELVRGRIEEVLSGLARGYAGDGNVRHAVVVIDCGPEADGGRAAAEQFKTQAESRQLAAEVFVE